MKLRLLNYLPIITNVILYQSHSSLPSKIAAQKHEIEAQNKVAEKSHFFPVLITIYIAIPIAGISTNPANAYRNIKKI